MVSSIKKTAKRMLIHFFARPTLRKSELKIDFVDNSKIEFFPQSTYTVQFIDNIQCNDMKYKWVGAQCDGDKVIFIPNDADKVLVMNKTIEYMSVRSGSFKWSGGCTWNGNIYAFSRSANSILRISDNSTSELPLHKKYIGEHHYSGTCTENGVIYLAPRNTNHILKYDLKTNICEEIEIIGRYSGLTLRYCCTIKHPNGYIYMLPERDGRVIMIDPITDKWRFIGEYISPLCFDAKVAQDGNIYGFSAGGKGLFKLEVEKASVTMMFPEIYFGAYGTKYGIDGYLYSVPGDGEYIYRFNVLNNQLEQFFECPFKRKAKYAGGITLRNGDMVFVPATAEKVLILKNDYPLVIDKKAYESIYADNY